MKISTRGRYAIEAVVDLALFSAEDHESLHNIAARRKISENYLEQIFIDLRRNGIVKSIRGAHGGYVLAKDAGMITCGEIIRSTERKISPVDCIAEGKNKKDCNRFEMCPTRILWEKIRDSVNEVADSVTVNELLEHLEEKKDTHQIEYYI
jgi:Rrf2 family transcriptional regulator, cysteine metabolism repressor